MNFIRNNTFLVICIVVTVVAIGGLIFWNMGAEKEVKSRLDQRSSVASKVRSFSRSPFANERTIKAEDEKNKRILEQFRKVRQTNDKYNSATFSMIQVLLPEGDVIPALPYNEELWKSKSLGYRYIEAYHKSLDKLLVSLSPAHPGTQKDISDKAESIQDRLEQEKRILDKDTATPKHTGARDLGGMPLGMPVQGRSGGEKKTLSKEAEIEAFQAIRVQQASRGVVFAKTDVLDVMFPREKAVPVSPQNIYDSWVSFNIQANVIKAINTTNQQAFDAQKTPKDNRNVTTAAIKRLYKIQVKPRKVSKTQASPTTIRRPGRRRIVPTVLVEPRADSLTGARTDKIGSVVQYAFSVLMRTSDLPLLEKALIHENYHVILSEEITPHFDSSLIGFEQVFVGDRDETSLRGKKDQEDKDESYYYYGTDPVRVVTILAEIRMLSGWTRGTWDEKTEKWNIAPLMPIEVLKELSSAALRPEDRKRMDGTLEKTAPAIKPTR